jgi:hypothetical protein
MGHPDKVVKVSSILTVRTKYDTGMAVSYADLRRIVRGQGECRAFVAYRWP